MGLQRGGVHSHSVTKLKAEARKIWIYALRTGLEERYLYVIYLLYLSHTPNCRDSLCFLLFGKSFSGPNRSVESQSLHLASSYFPEDSSKSARLGGSRNMSPSAVGDVHDHDFIPSSNHAESPLVSHHPPSQLPLKDRLAPLVIQNANLRSGYEQHEANHNQGRPSINDKNVESALTPDVCESIVSSLFATVMQLKELDPMPCLEPYTDCPVHTKRSEGTTSSITNNLLPSSSVQVTAPSTTVPSTPPQSPPRPSPNSGSSTFQTTMHQTDNHTSAEINGASTNSTSRAYQASPTAESRHQEQTAIPIPISAMFFNNAPFPQTPKPPSHSSSDVTSHEYAKRPGDRTGSSWNHPSSPNERPYKRPRSRSPPPSWHYKNGDRRRGRDAFSPSPPPRPGRSPPTSPSYQRRHQLPPYVSRRSRSPRSRRSPSPRRSRSPRREPGHSSSSRRQSFSTYHRGRSPVHSSSRSAREYEYSRHTRGERSETNISPSSTRPTSERYPNAKSVREPYLTAHEREQYQGSSKRGDEKDQDPRRRHSIAQESEGTQGHNRPTGQMTAIEPTTEGQTIGKIRSSPIALPTPPASATSTVDHNMELEQTANISDSAELALNGAQRDAGSLPQGAKLGEALNVSVEPGAQSPSAHIHANDLPEKGESLTWWSHRKPAAGCCSCTQKTASRVGACQLRD